MNGETVLIAAYSGRALAASARRAGFEPLVVDAFGDSDTRHAAAAYRELPEALNGGFRAKPLLAALAELSARAQRAPIGLVLGSGFEDTPKLIAKLSQHYRLLGNGADTVQRAKHPELLAALLAELDVAHPETRTAPPADPAGWLSKRSGGSGGRHIRAARIGERPNRHRYFQRVISGEQFSLSGIASRSGLDLRSTRQWCQGGGTRPYRYGGAITHPTIDWEIAARMQDDAHRVVDALDLVGLVSFDFRIFNGRPHLLDINPRPGATLDVLDTADGALFRAHVAAFLGTPMPRALQDIDSGVRTAALLYADEGALTVPALAWPNWAADRPQPGTEIPRGRPIATVLTNASTARDAERRSRLRLEELSDLLYGHASRKERDDEEFEGSGSQRLRAGR